jgi:thiol-disulfide isomerase/thioredoxin
MSDRFTHHAFAGSAMLIASLIAANASADTPSAKAALSLKPVQRNVEYELVPSDLADQCVVQDIKRSDWSGWEVLAADGTMLRRFADTNKDAKLDLWCYFNYGVEVYRDIDGDFNGKADQYRWLGTGGTKWGVDEDEDGSIDRWKRISAEEVSEELINALGSANENRFARLLISQQELRSLGLGDSRTEQLSKKTAQAASQFAELAKQQQVVNETANWVQFAAPPPGIVPAGTQGSTSDLLVYENAVAMFEQEGKNGQLLVGTLVQVGDAWRLLDLPSVGDDEAIAQSTGVFFRPVAGSMAASSGDPQAGQQSQQLVSQLEKLDAKLLQTTDKKELATLHDARADVVEQLIKSAATSEERATWVRQLVDTVSVAVQSGNYPGGVARLRSVARTYARGDEALASYADFNAISSEYVVKQTPDAKFEQVQEWYLDALTGFIDRYPTTLEAAQATLQLALSKEFEDKESDALKFYRKVATSFPNTDAGEKAAGAVRRLESQGQRIELAGTTIGGQAFSLSSLRGKPVVIHYWATWCDPCKQDMKQLGRLQTRFKGLQLVGVNVDSTRELATGFLKANPLSWTQLFEEGGLESSPLAKAFGVQTLPTMMLVDKSGKVVRHNIRVEELDVELEKLYK